jgi:hypothetical protein
MKTIAVIHFMPLEYYPPVANFLNVLPQRTDLIINVFTCHNIKSRIYYQQPGVRIKRVPFPNIKEATIIRFFKYWVFNFSTLKELVWNKPDIVYYYETYSAWPVYAYLRLFNSQARLFIHNHEYFDNNWYRKGMKLVNWYHRLEVNFLYERAEWISQTNHYRNELFAQDHPFIPASKLKVLRNFPPKTWAELYPKRKENNSRTTRFVYIGSLSLTNTYLREFCQWIIDQNGRASFDIYSFNLHDEVVDYINKLDSEYIRIHSDGIEYNKIPKILSSFDVGVILYKAYSKNVVYCVSNKFYEYKTCGLDIWYSKDMIAIENLETPDGMPGILGIDFTQLKPINNYEVTKSIKRGIWILETCEHEYRKLIDVF